MKSVELMLGLVLVLGFVFLLSETYGAETGIHYYNGYKVLRMKSENKLQYKALEHLYLNENFDFWAGPSANGFTDIMVDPSRKDFLENYLTSHGLKYNVFVEDVERLVAEQRKTSRGRKESRMDWEDYQLIETIYDWIDELVDANPNLVSIETIGQSLEGRDLKVLKISTGGTNKTAFWIDATIHSREWISTSTITYIINELINKNSEYQDILSIFDFYLLPIINPDGYVYTHETDRMWRKSRSNHEPSSGCRGVDINRNFGFHWGEAGSSTDPCSETYRGPNAYSEPEAEAVKDYIHSKTDVNWYVFITLHSYSQLWMTPWGYSYDLTEDYEELESLGNEAVAELASHFGTEYTVGSAANILYASSGSSRDWAKGEGSFTYVYTIELRDTGSFGFVLPKEQIIPTAIETWAGIQVVARNFLKKNNN